jgi:UDP-N-acetyl-D-glucosamine dehydrogenase
MKNIVVIGQGYVGLPISIAAASAGFEVIGLDKNAEKVVNLNLGISRIEDISDFELKKYINSGNYRATEDYSVIKNADVVLICVPTPLSDKGIPDLAFLHEASFNLAKFLKRDTLIVLESTVEPGTTRDYLVPLLESGSNYLRSEFDVAFSPERIDPTNKFWNLKNTPKLIAGLTKEARKRACTFYSTFIDNIIECDSIEVAETAKLLENSFRLVNISFVNEISMFCQKIGIDVNKVIAAASTKPYGFMPFYPSIGVGGHCIPVDPLYLAHKASQVGASVRLINLADQINQELPGYFVSRAEEKIGDLNGRTVLVIGVSYKSNVADVRQTPVEALILGLKHKGAVVDWHDDLVKEWNGEKSTALSDKYDLAILATPHDYLDLKVLGGVPILNTRG